MKTYIFVSMMFFALSALADSKGPNMGEMLNRKVCVDTGCGPCFKACKEAQSGERFQNDGNRGVSSEVFRGAKKQTRKQ